MYLFSPHTTTRTHNIHRALTVLRDAEQSGEKTVVTDVPFELRGFSLATVGLGLGGLITIGSLAEYLISSGSEGLSGVGFVYGIPILLIGLSLQYAQLNPVPVEGVENGELTFSMVFKSDDTPYRLWVEPERIARYDKFFGPGVWSIVEKVDAERRLVAIKLITGERPVSAVEPKQEEAETAAAATPASA
eukprot:evm.model.NODE_21584_length_11053_cov_29.592690.2